MTITNQNTNPTKDQMGNNNSQIGLLPTVYNKRKRRRKRKPLLKKVLFLAGFLVCTSMFYTFFIEADEKGSSSIVIKNKSTLSINLSSEIADKSKLTKPVVSMEVMNLMEFPKLGSKEFLKPPLKLIPASIVFSSKPDITNHKPPPKLKSASMMINSHINTPDKSVSNKEIQEIYKQELIRLLTDDLSKQIKVKPTLEL